MNKLIREHRIQADEVADFRLPIPRADPIPGKSSAGAQTRAAHQPGAVPTSIIYHAQVRARNGEEPPPPAAPSTAEKEILGAAGT